MNEVKEILESIEEEYVAEPIDSSFLPIYNGLIKKHGEDEGKRIYYAWLNAHGLDDTKDLGDQKDKLRGKRELRELLNKPRSKFESSMRYWSTHKSQHGLD
jgi:hypothetical protein